MKKGFFSVPLDSLKKMLSSNPDESGEFPAELFCNGPGCDELITCLGSFGLSVPLGHALAPADFCSLECMSRWLLAARNVGVTQ